MTFERIVKKLELKDVFVVTTRKYAEMTLEEIPELPKENLIIEPTRRNTAPAITYSMFKIPEHETVLVLPSDHYIPNVKKFWKIMERAEDFLERNEGCLLTFGVVPTRPETSYGYIEKGEEIEENVYRVKRFREKPSYEVAEEFLESGSFFWNTGMFMWKVETFLHEMEKLFPSILLPLRESGEKGYEKVPSISIDYALMERTESACVIKADFEWSDVGNWKSLEDLGYKKEGRLITVDADGIYSLSEKPVLVVGVSDIVIVESDSGLLVASKKDLEKIREGVKRIIMEFDRHGKKEVK